MLLKVPASVSEKFRKFEIRHLDKETRLEIRTNSEWVQTLKQHI